MSNYTGGGSKSQTLYRGGPYAVTVNTKERSSRASGTAVLVGCASCVGCDLGCAPFQTRLKSSKYKLNSAYVFTDSGSSW